jgi:stage V sporulation protein AD
MIDGGYATNTAAVTSSHFCTAERQYRTPLEYGAQRTPTAQWTVTGSGAVILTEAGPGPYITHMTCGKIIDLGITDANNMGAAMAPAAYDTLSAHFQDTGLTPSAYDLIVTGDLGTLGKEIVIDLFSRGSLDFGSKKRLRRHDLRNGAAGMHRGVSGCGCSGLCSPVTCSTHAGRPVKKILFAATGALLSPVSTQQKESIPSICHAVAISTTVGG